MKKFYSSNQKIQPNILNFPLISKIAVPVQAIWHGYEVVQRDFPIDSYPPQPSILH